MIEPIAKPKQVKGRITKEWLAYRRQWLKANPPNFQGWYICGICGQHVHQEAVELDHILNRSTHPGLRLDDSNIRPVHGICNSGRKA